MILCLTPNPAIDRTLVVPNLTLGKVHRASETIVAAGGKGLNVARAIRLLGGESCCMGFAGGHSGHLFADLAQE
jgi:fructose-1-phosphate kinase PfkB-like protein